MLWPKILVIKISNIYSLFSLIVFPLIFILPSSANSSEIKNLDGIWFICEYSVSNNPPNDNCEMLDNDGFLVEKGLISHLKIKNSQQEGCRGNRKGHCFKNGIPGLKAKKRKIGEFLIGSNWVEVDYLSCKQRFWFKENKNFWHGWPDDKKCFWTRKKEFFVKRYNGKLTIN